MSSNEINNFLCPCCGKVRVGEYDICPTCGWENDPIQAEHPEMAGGANQMSLQEARKAYQAGTPII